MKSAKNNHVRHTEHNDAADTAQPTAVQYVIRSALWWPKIRTFIAVKANGNTITTLYMLCDK